MKSKKNNFNKKLKANKNHFLSFYENYKKPKKINNFIIYVKMRHNINMNKIKGKTIFKTFTIFANFVICVLFMFVFLHFTTNLKTANCEIKPIKIKQISNGKAYKNKNIENVTYELKEKEYPKIQFVFKGKIYNPTKKMVLSETQKSFSKKGFYERVKIMKFAVLNGFSFEESVLYSFPEFEKPIEKICEIGYKNATNASLGVIKNTAKTIINKHKNGTFIDKNELFSQIFDSFLEYKSEYKFEIYEKEIVPSVLSSDIEKTNFLRSSYKTNFKSSSESRKNNIKIALSCFDGICLLPGEVLSFNQTTGIRNSSNGYEKAKIIKNGMFVDEYGGGVCQVSSTLYNASLLSGLEILQSHNHSLPVSYVEPGFDAMVNIGSSDLVVKNNFNFPILIATSSENDACLINIFGCKKLCKYVKKYKKINENIHFDTVFVCDNKLYNMPEIEDGEEVVINAGKCGFTVETSLECYENGVLLYTKPLRKSVYNPTKRVVLLSENDYKKRMESEKNNH